MTTTTLPALTRQLIIAILDYEDRPAGTPLWVLAEWLDLDRDAIRPWLTQMVTDGALLEVMPDRYVALHSPVGTAARTIFRPVLVR